MCLHVLVPTQSIYRFESKSRIARITYWYSHLFSIRSGFHFLCQNNNRYFDTCFIIKLKLYFKFLFYFIGCSTDVLSTQLFRNRCRYYDRKKYDFNYRLIKVYFLKIQIAPNVFLCNRAIVSFDIL